jgi:hypothetical protein
MFLRRTGVYKRQLSLSLDVPKKTIDRRFLRCLCVFGILYSLPITYFTPHPNFKLQSNRIWFTLYWLSRCLSFSRHNEIPSAFPFSLSYFQSNYSNQISHLLVNPFHSSGKNPNYFIVHVQTCCPHGTSSWWNFSSVLGVGVVAINRKKTSNQGMNRTFIHPFVGPVMLWSLSSSPRDIGCINAGYPIR